MKCVSTRDASLWCQSPILFFVFCSKNPKSMTGLRCKLVVLFPLFSSSRTSNRWDAQVSRRVKKSMLMLSRYFITPPTFFFPEGGHNGPLTRAFQITAFWRHCCVPLFPCFFFFFFWLLPWINAAEIYLSIGHRRRWGQLVPRKLLIIHERTEGVMDLGHEAGRRYVFVTGHCWRWIFDDFNINGIELMDWNHCDD